MNDETRPEKGESAGAALIGVIVLTILSVPTGALFAVIATDPYRWFIQPFGLPAIGWLSMWGLLLCWAMLRMIAWRDLKMDTEPKLSRSFAVLTLKVISGLLIWASGTVIHGFAQ